jgi:hypothetical protein
MDAMAFRSHDLVRTVCHFRELVDDALKAAMSVLSNVRNIPLPGKFVDAGEHTVAPAPYAQLAGRAGIEGETFKLQTVVTFQVDDNCPHEYTVTDKARRLHRGKEGDHTDVLLHTLHSQMSTPELGRFQLLDQVREPCVNMLALQGHASSC